MSFDALAFRKQFPFFDNYPEVIYWDNAATTQKPKSVIQAMTESLSAASNIHRSSYHLAAKKTEQFEQARASIAAFIGADAKELVFTKGTTESMNLIAYGLTHQLKPNDKILISGWEHHANIVPWQELAKRTAAKLEFLTAEAIQNQTVDFDNAKILAITDMSNVMGAGLAIAPIINAAKSKQVLTIVDGAQAVAHKRIDVKAIGVDAYVFSGHKVYAPEGIGAAYISENLQAQLQPFQTGGEMIRSVTTQGSEFKDFPHGYEAGSQNISAVIAFAEAIAFIEPQVELAKAYVEQLTQQLVDELLIKGRAVKLVNPNSYHHGIISFHGDFDSLDMAMILAEHNICVRAGKHCAEPLLTAMGLDNCLRISLAPYNLEEEIPLFLDAFDQALALLTH